jgi:hypothetical protein
VRRAGQDDDQAASERMPSSSDATVERGVRTVQNTTASATAPIAAIHSVFV